LSSIESIIHAPNFAANFYEVPDNQNFKFSVKLGWLVIYHGCSRHLGCLPIAGNLQTIRTVTMSRKVKNIKATHIPNKFTN
jgi:hypothetical protein